MGVGPLAVLFLYLSLVWCELVDCNAVVEVSPHHPISAFCRSPVWGATGGPASLLHDALGFVGTTLGLVTDTPHRAEVIGCSCQHQII